MTVSPSTASRALADSSGSFAVGALSCAIAGLRKPGLPWFQVAGLGRRRGPWESDHPASLPVSSELSTNFFIILNEAHGVAGSDSAGLGPPPAPHAQASFMADDIPRIPTCGMASAGSWVHIVPSLSFLLYRLAQQHWCFPMPRAHQTQLVPGSLCCWGLGCISQGPCGM